jgi:hypothetical protein
MKPLRMDDFAADQLRYIRETMQAAKPITIVPGWGGVLMGALALAASIYASGLDAGLWLRTWMATAVLSIAVGFFTMRQKSTVSFG